MNKLKSTTFWITVSAIILNPLAWISDYIFKMNTINHLIDKGIIEKSSDITNITGMIIDFPLTTLATATITVATAYVGGNKGRDISNNLKNKQQKA